ncbi:hypothetical protein C0583_00360 [Candidatus Parcubacteria bacterium]|nr:MAG: hypothetical protein C0583_00360 [Candidatus Parcubacteria bacterium]
MEKLNIVGQNLDQSDIDAASDYIKGERKRLTGARIEGSYEKEDSDKEIINFANNLLNSELSELGEAELEDLENKVYLFPDNKFREIFDGADRALYDSINDSIAINLDENIDDLDYLSKILHEAIHKCSYNKFFLDKEDNHIAVARSGYKNSSQKEGVYFRGFNEVVTEKMNQDIMEKNWDAIVSKLNLNDDIIAAYRERRLDYHDYIDVVDGLVNKIADKKSESSEKIWLNIKKGYLNGEMMHLREIEKEFGPGALRFLSLMTENPDNLAHEELMLNIKGFFDTDDQDEKNKYAQKLLPNNEYNKYLNTVTRVL